jgi:hypothetical protein
MYDLAAGVSPATGDVELLPYWGFSHGNSIDQLTAARLGRHPVEIAAVVLAQGKAIALGHHPGELLLLSVP